MRHTITENINVLGKFNTGDTVTISLYKISDESVVGLDSNSCNEISTSGVFKWNSSEITTAPTVFTEYLWVMDNSTYKQYGKIVLGGYPDDIKNAVIITSGSINDVSPTNASFDTTLTENIDGFWNRGAFVSISGQNKGIIRKIQNYTAATKRIHVRTALPYTPINGDKFNIIPARCFRTNYDDVTKIVNDVWDEQMAGHAITGTVGNHVRRIKNQKV